MAEQPDDLVISYAVDGRELDPQYVELQEALGKGYRVVELLQTAAIAGGESSHYGHVVVTVLLTRSAAGLPYLAVHAPK
jgi:hypothetical protein